VNIPWLTSREHESAALRAWLLPLYLLSLGYGLAARSHRALYEGRWLTRRRLSCRVVSVGSLVVGGGGKTPFAAWLASRLRERGNRVVLATRGYGRRNREAVHALSDGRYLRGDVTGMGDEPLILAAHAARVPVLVGRDRGLVGLRAISTFGAEILVLDDGFQHHRLARDLDILTLDGGFGLGNRRLLPRGPLREPISALARAHAIGVLDGPLPREDSDVLDARAIRPYRFRILRHPSRLRSIDRDMGKDATRDESPGALAGVRIGMLAAIGQPDAFQRTLEALGATVIARRIFRDHHRYRARDLRDLERDAALWVTSEKDAVKILPAWARRVDLRVLTIELQVDDGDAFVDWVEKKLR
jgi:tetraacyldisaccharide 4'-kinase